MSDVGMPKPEAAELTDGSDMLPTQLAAMSSVACTVGGGRAVAIWWQWVSAIGVLKK